MSSSAGSGGRGKASMQCVVLLLDGRQLTIGLSPRAFGEELYGKVHGDLQLVETDYFGLEFKASDETNRWLDKGKSISEQTGSKSSMMFIFKVKFYPADPTTLKEEYTRYLFALQLRDDLASGRLQCCGQTAALLAAYVVQSELGDYESAAVSSLPLSTSEEIDDETAYLRNIKLVAAQTPELQRTIVELHRSMRGLKPAEADSQLLEAARKTDFYGIVLNAAKDADGVPQSLAVTEAGILVYQNNQRVNVFSWAKIRELCFRRKRFLVKLRPAADKAHPTNLVEFSFPSRNRAKAFWKLCVEHHAFFCCQEAPVHQAKQWRNHVLTRGSTFRYSGRTQVQLIDHVKDNLVKSRPFARSRSFGTMASSPSCGSASQGMVTRTLPTAFRECMTTCNPPAGVSSTLASSTPGLDRRLPNALTGPPPPAPKDKGSAAERPPETSVAAEAVAAAAAAAAASPAGSTALRNTSGSGAAAVTAFDSDAVGRMSSEEPHEQRGVASVATAVQQSPNSKHTSGHAGAWRLANGTGHLANGAGAVELDAEVHSHDDGVSLSSSSSSSAPSVHAANADGDDIVAGDVADDADSLAKLEDAIRSLAAAELKVTAANRNNGDAESRDGGIAGVESAASLKRRLAQAGVDAERAARQQARDEVLLACRASSLRRSLRRSSTRSAEEEMAQLEDVSDIAAKVMHSTAAAAADVGMADVAVNDRRQPSELAMQLLASERSRPTPQVLGRGQRLSSLQDLCDLASKVMQYDSDLTVSAPLLPGFDPPSASGTSVEPVATATAAQRGLSPSPPPLPAKQQQKQQPQPHAAASSKEPPWTGHHTDDDGGLDSSAASASFANTDLNAGDYACDAPPLPPKCNPQPLHGSLPRNFMRGNRAHHDSNWKTATAPRQPASAAGAANACSSAADSAGSIDTAIRLPMRTRPAAASSSSSSSSSSVSSPSSSLPRVNGREAVYKLSPSDRSICAVVSAPTLESRAGSGAIRRGSAAIDDELEAALSASASPVTTPKAAADPEALPVTSDSVGGSDNEKPSAVDERTPPALQRLVVTPVNGTTAGLADSGEAVNAGQLMPGNSWSKYQRILSAPLSPDVDDVFVDDPTGVAATSSSADHCDASSSVHDPSA